MGVDLMVTNGLGRSINLNDGVNWYCLQLGGTGVPAPRTWFEQLPYEHGALYIGMKYPERQLTAQVVLKAESYAERLQLEAELADVLGTHRGILTIDIVLPNGSQRRIYGVLTDGLQYAPESLIGPTARRLAIVFTCPDPLFRSVTATRVTLPDWGASGSFIYYGTAPTYPTFELQGPVTNPQIRNLNTGQKLAFTLTLAANQTLIITTAPGHKTAVVKTVNGDVITFSDVTTTITPDSSLWAIERRANAVMMVAGSGSGPSGSMTYVTRYLTLG
jgi:hypothetical protein